MTRCCSRPGVASLLATLLVATLATGCSGLLPAPRPQPAFYLIDGLAGAAPPVEPAVGARAPDVAAEAAPDAPPARPTLVVAAPRAAPGFDSPAMIYQRQPHRLERYARSQWIATPQRMLAPLIGAALVDSGAVRLALSGADGGSADLRLDTQILRLVQDFGSQPSRVRFVLRATLMDDATRRVIAVHTFETEAAAPSDDAAGGVSAANQAVHHLLLDLAGWCRRSAAQRLRPAAALPPR